MKHEAQYYPVLLRLEGRKCLVVGGGEVALRKAEALRKAGAKVRVVSPEFSGTLRRWKGVESCRRSYRSSDLRGVVLVIAATDDPAVNRRVAREAKAAGVPVNVVDQPDLCTFIVPASVKRGRLTFSISTGGASPALAAAIRRRLARLFGPEYTRLTAALTTVRSEAMRKIADPKTRRRALQEMASPHFLRQARRLSVSELCRVMRKVVCAAATRGLRRANAQRVS